MSNIPSVLTDSLQNTKGFDKEAFLTAHDIAPATSVRVHPVKGIDVFNNLEEVPWCSEGRYLPQRPVFTTDPLFHAGAYYVQEASSMFTGYLLKEIIGDRKGLRVLDLCAAPGGKSTHIASLLDSESLLVSNEVIRSRASVLSENMTRWGYMNTWVTSNDPKEFSKLKGYFDIIVVDAPCSGSGMFRKDEKAIDEWSEANVMLCAERQKRILADVWSALKQDGILIYSTCSYSQQENEDVADWLADNFSVENTSADVKEDWGIIATSSAKHDIKGWRFYPDKVKGEGFFITAFKKTEEQSEVKRNRIKHKEDTGVKEQAIMMFNHSDWVLINEKESYTAISPNHLEDYHLLQKHIYLRKTGVSLGSPSKKEWFPAHDIALSIDRSIDLPTVDASREQALKFLKKEDPEISGLSKGWYVVSYEGKGLGLIKALGNRINNYLPKELRIRMDINYEDWA